MTNKTAQNTKNQSVRELLFENNFCRIYKYDDRFGHSYQPFVREDKILGSRVVVNSYFNESGEFIEAKELNCEFCNIPMTEIEHDFCDICPDCREGANF
tara:strand:+ start:3828 stop:4124 length:297 start_codon:yes stop_codon:yes gene_type:complete